MPWFYYVGRLLIRVILFLLTRWQVRGRENIPSHGPLLIVANHINLADPPVLSVSIRRKVIFMAKEELFRSRFVGYFVRSFGAFPVRRGRVDRRALRHAEQVLADGLVLVMFPEGTRGRGGQLLPAFPGSALIARRSGVPVLPVGIVGTDRIRGIGWIVRRPQITINIGHPFHLPASHSGPTRTELAELSDYIMGHVAELLLLEYQGEKYGANKLNDIED